MKDPAKLKQVQAYTLDPEVIERVETLAESLGVSRSVLVNMQLRIALNMVDTETEAFLNRGVPPQRIVGEE